MHVYQGTTCNCLDPPRCEARGRDNMHDHDNTNVPQVHPNCMTTTVCANSAAGLWCTASWSERASTAQTMAMRSRLPPQQPLKFGKTRGLRGRLQHCCLRVLLLPRRTPMTLTCLVCSSASCSHNACHWQSIQCGNMMAGGPIYNMMRVFRSTRCWHRKLMSLPSVRMGL